ncbi:MAG TPA: hypothetical protein VMC83_10040 [Streptosporangiaceae bacterium]|nr:hypothetical protein [Streptosporangiaceae bacterium]
MKVSSPVGDFPFEPLRLKAGAGHLTLEGQVGAWPARVEFTPGDIVALARAAGARAAVPALATVVAVSLARRWMRHG